MRENRDREVAPKCREWNFCCGDRAGLEVLCRRTARRGRSAGSGVRGRGCMRRSGDEDVGFLSRGICVQMNGHGESRPGDRSYGEAGGARCPAYRFIQMGW